MQRKTNLRLVLHQLESERKIKTIAESDGITTNAMATFIRSEKLAVSVDSALFDEFTVVLDASANLVNAPIIRARVWDGQTFVAIYPKSDGENALAVFITPTIVDPAGNRIHPKNELPPKASTIPPQD